MKKILMLAVVAIALSACSDSDGAKRHLSNMGFTNIETQGWSFFGCSEDDFWKTEFTAKGPTGQNVEGVVCEGFFFKGATVRFD